MFLFSYSPSLILAFISLTFGGIFLSGFSTMQGALVYQASTKSKGNNFGILVTCIGTAPIGLMNLTWIMTLISVDRTIQINVFLGLLCLLITIFYFFFKNFRASSLNNNYRRFVKQYVGKDESYISFDDIFKNYNLTDKFNKIFSDILSIWDKLYFNIGYYFSSDKYPV